jgi:hypothetical protein
MKIPFFLPWWKRLGDVMVSTDDITEINKKNLMGQHSGFAFVFGSQFGGSLEPDTFWR